MFVAYVKNHQQDKNMSTTSTFYLNAPSLSSATAVFLNSDLTVCAPNGFYSDGVIVREQISCVLLPQQTCPSCSIPCGSPIAGSGGRGIYLVNLDAGTDIGAIIIRFEPYSVPDGIRATFNSIVYNKITSPIDGLHQSSDVNNYTFIGNTSGDCGISGTTYPTLQEFLYNGSSFVSTGNTQSVTVNPGDVSLGASPGSCMMVIPKTTTSPSIINFQIVGPCIYTSWLINISCPVLLTGFSSSLVSSTALSVCELSQNQIYYNASLDNTPGIVDVYDFVYSDNKGLTQLANGFYKATGNIAGGADWFEVLNGVVVAVGNCTGIDCLEYTISTSSAQAQSFTYTDCDGVSQSGSVGGVGGYDAQTVCAEENTVVGTGETTTTLNGPCTI